MIRICWIHLFLLLASQLLAQEMIALRNSSNLQKYESLDGDKICELVDARPDLLTQADNCGGISLHENEILLFVTSDLRLGKLLVLKIDEKKTLHFKYRLYSQTSNALYRNQILSMDDGDFLDIDKKRMLENCDKAADFKWVVTDQATLIPQNNIGIYLLRSTQNKISN